MDVMTIGTQIEEAILRASIQIPRDVEDALARAAQKEDTEIARSQLRAIREDVELAWDERRPICQDTGIVSFYVTAGFDFPHTAGIVRQLGRSLVKATNEIPLRPNTTHPFTGANPGDNTGPNMPMVDVMFVEGDSMTIDVLPKGGGSENQSFLWMLTPAEGVKGFRKRLVDHIQKAGGKPCPPLILGIGMGSPADLALRLAKRALARPLGRHHGEKAVADLEAAIADDLNDLGVGPMGLGGRTTVLDVHIEYTSRHPASFPVALAVQCWADRRARVTVSRNLDVRVEQ